VTEHVGEEELQVVVELDDGMRLSLSGATPWGEWGLNPRPKDYESLALTG
jgi:hypothetical protein